MKKFFLLIIAFISLSLSVMGQNNLPSSVVKATQNGDARSLAEGFNSSLKLILPNKSGVFSKSQAEYMMGDFFRQNAPSSFTIIHQGQRENASFAIGKYISSTGTYRFYFLTKNDSGKILIHQLRIEEQNE